MDFTNFIQQYGFWAALIYIVFDKAIIPLINNLLPAKVKQQIDKEERQTVAIESIAKAIAINNERLSQVEKSVSQQNSLASDNNKLMTMLESANSIKMDILLKHSEALAVLLDRAGVKANSPRKVAK